MPAIQFVYHTLQQDGGQNDHWYMITPTGRILAQVYDRQLKELLEGALNERPVRGAPLRPLPDVQVGSVLHEAPS
jgi:hypothetical protein